METYGLDDGTLYGVVLAGGLTEQQGYTSATFPLSNNEREGLLRLTGVGDRRHC